MVASLIFAATAVAGYGQGTIYIANIENTGVYDGNGGSVTNPVYSYAVSQNGLIFTADPTEQAGNLGGPAGSQLIGDDFSWALYGGSSAISVNTLIASEAGSQIKGDNVFWGELYGGNSPVQVPGTLPNSTVYLELFVWEGDTYTSWAEAAANEPYVGESGVFSNPSGSELNPGPFSDRHAGYNAVYPFPEPGDNGTAGNRRRLAAPGPAEPRLRNYCGTLAGMAVSQLSHRAGRVVRKTPATPAPPLPPRRTRGTIPEPLGCLTRQGQGLRQMQPRNYAKIVQSHLDCRDPGGRFLFLSEPRAPIDAVGHRHRRAGAHGE